MIEFRDVSFIHQTGVVALNHVNLRIEEEQTLAIVGENGAGKTTLVKHIIGLLKPSSGQVFVDGEDASTRTTAELSRKVGVAFQNPDHQLFSESVEKEVGFALRNFGLSPDVVTRRVDWALNFFGLEAYRKSSPLTLSGGEKKRLTIACILAWDPKVVIMDEPTVGQDAIQKEKLTEIIKLLRSSGKSVIIVSHDIEFLWPIQPRIVVMSKGSITADGPSAEIMQERELLANARVSQPELVSIYQGLSRRPNKPFTDVYSARSWLTEAMR